MGDKEEILKSRERLLQIMQNEGLDIPAFGKKIKKPRADQIRNVLNKKNVITNDLALLITQNLKRYRYEWVLNGEGEMLLKPDERIIKNPEPPPIDDRERLIASLNDRIKEQSERIKEQAATIICHEKCIEELRGLSDQDSLPGTG